MLAAIGNRQNVLVHEVAYPSKNKDVVLACPQSKQLLIHSVAAYNGTVSSVDIGIGYQLDIASWNFFQIVGGVVSNGTTALQTGNTVDLFSTTANDGFYLQSKTPFNSIYFNLAQAQTGSPVYEYTYWNGSAFVALTMLTAPSYGATGPAYVSFIAPVDWAVGAGGAISTTIQGSLGYVIRVRATTAPSQAVQADAAGVTKFLAYRGQIGPNQHLQIKFERPKILESGEGVIAYFGSASNSNLVDVCYQLEG